MTSADRANKASSPDPYSDRGNGQGLNAEYNTTDKVEQGSSANDLPTVGKASLHLECVNNKDVVKVIAGGMAKNNDAVTLGYEWFKNGELAGSGDSISDFKRGDKLSVKITPFDGKDYGSPKTLSIEINNCTPKINEYKEVKFDGNTYIGQIRATDPDDDPLTYSLKSGPAGMTIDPSTGLIKWNVPTNFVGKTSFTVSVFDGHGGEASQTFALDVKQEQKTKW